MLNIKLFHRTFLKPFLYNVVTLKLSMVQNVGTCSKTDKGFATFLSVSLFHSIKLTFVELY